MIRKALLTSRWLWVWWLAGIPAGLLAYEIKGVIQLDAPWQRVIYLSAIRSFDDLNAVSEDLIVNKALIAADGSFTIAGDNLPETDGLYRLHVCKIDDPAATLIIGGREENHLHFVLNNRSQLRFSSSELLFRSATLKGHPANALLSTLRENIARWKQPPLTPTKTNWEYNQQQLNRYLHRFADTCRHGVVALLAVHALDVTEDYKQHPSFYHQLLQKWEAPYGETLYYQELAQQIELLRYQKSPTNPVLISALLITLGLLMTAAFLFRTKARQQATPTEHLPRLSVQEQKVFDLLTEGRANKEISSELNIEISTVKSHINSIYGKLGIKSRKELYRGKES